MEYLHSSTFLARQSTENCA